jgi:hypothetical protein
LRNIEAAHRGKKIKGGFVCALRTFAFLFGEAGKARLAGFVGFRF